MSAWFDLELDTTGPVVSWGAPSGTTAGELLRVPYTANEALGSARLRLQDGRVLTMDLLAGRLEVLLPPDMPDGNGQITVTDEVGNQATVKLIALTGAIGGYIPEASNRGAPGMGPRDSRRPIEHRVVTTTSTVTTRSASSTSSLARQITTVVPIYSQRSSVQLHGLELVAVNTTYRVRATPSTTEETAVHSATTVRRREDLELLTALDLL